MKFTKTFLSLGEMNTLKKEDKNFVSCGHKYIIIITQPLSLPTKKKNVDDDAKNCTVIRLYWLSGVTPLSTSNFGLPTRKQLRAAVMGVQ